MLKWISGQHLVKQSNESILSGIEIIHKDWRIDFDKAFKLSVINLMKIRSKSLVDLMTQTDYFFSDPREFDEKDVSKTWKNDTSDIVSDIQIILMEIDQWNGESLEKKLKSFMEEKGLGFGKVMKPIRLAICGTINGPSLFEILSLLGFKHSLQNSRV